jgi:hypothetical protein
MVQAKVELAGVRAYSPAFISVAIAPTFSPTGASIYNANTYILLALPGNFIDLTYTFTSGDPLNPNSYAPANSFNVSASSLPVGAEITGGTCPLGSDVRQLAVSSNCTVIVRAPRQSMLDGGLLGTTNLSVLLTYSWQDLSGGGGKQQFNIGDTVTQTVRLTNGWLTTPTAVANPFGADVGGLSSTKVKFTFASPVVGAGVSYPIRVDATIPGNADTASCWINGPGETTCTTDDLSIPANSPAGVYNINRPLS